MYIIRTFSHLICSSKFGICSSDPNERRPGTEVHLHLKAYYAEYRCNPSELLPPSSSSDILRHFHHISPTPSAAHKTEKHPNEEQQ